MATNLSANARGNQQNSIESVGRFHFAPSYLKQICGLFPQLRWSIDDDTDLTLVLAFFGLRYHIADRYLVGFQMKFQSYPDIVYQATAVRRCWKGYDLFCDLHAYTPMVTWHLVLREFRMIAQNCYISKAFL